MELVEEVNKKVGVSNKEKVNPGQVMKSVHLDGTSMYVQGEYKKKEGEMGEEESEMKGIELRHGYSRDHRPDLKQSAECGMVTCNQTDLQAEKTVYYP